MKYLEKTLGGYSKYMSKTDLDTYFPASWQSLAWPASTPSATPCAKSATSTWNSNTHFYPKTPYTDQTRLTSSSSRNPALPPDSSASFSIVHKTLGTFPITSWMLSRIFTSYRVTLSNPVRNLGFYVTGICGGKMFCFSMEAVWSVRYFKVSYFSF